MMRARRGFTLVEVMVASLLLVIILGGVYATFSAGRRATLIVEERGDLVQTARVLLTRITAELEELYLEPPPLESSTTATGGTPGGAATPSGAGETPPSSELGAETPEFPGIPTDTAAAGEGSAAAEEEGASLPPLLGSRDENGAPDADQIEFTARIGPRRRGELPPTTLARVQYYLDTDDSTEEQGLIRTENRYLDLAEDEEGTRVEELSPLVRSLEFRYYDGEAEEWADEWDQEAPPLAVEVSLVVADPEEREEPVDVSGVVSLKLVSIRPIGEDLAGQQEQQTTPTSTEEGAPQGPETLPPGLENMWNVPGLDGGPALDSMFGDQGQPTAPPDFGGGGGGP